jgi:hypothetical protein
MFNDEPAPWEGDVPLFREKPSAFLYLIEATRMVAVIVLLFSVVLVLLLFVLKGAPILFLVELTAIIDIVLFSVFILILTPVAFGMEFVVTKEDVIVRFSPFGIGARRLSVPVGDIAEIEVRGYGPRYGSVYLKRYGSARRPTTIKKVQDNASPWTSLPWSWPMAGFYGFKNYDQFADLIVGLRSEA